MRISRDGIAGACVAALAMALVAGAVTADGEKEGQATARKQRVIAIRAGRMVDVRKGTMVENAVIVIEGERIRAAGLAASVKIPKGAEVVNWSKLTVMPGLIDAHVHLAWGPAQAGQPIPGTAEAKATLEAGFTTVRNPGSTGKADLELRDAIASGKVAGPRMLAAGPALGKPGGVCDQAFAGEGRASGLEEVRKKVQEILDAGADFIKLCAGGGVVAGPNQAGATEFTEEEIRAIVEEAHARGKKVAAHAQGPAAIANAVRAGVDSIEHGALIDEATARLMKVKGVYLAPTLYRLDWQIETAEKGGAAAGQLEAMRKARDATHENVRRAIELGVPIVFGTDATVYPHGLNAREFAVLVKLGMTPAEAIRTATVNAAELLGWKGEVGEIAAGRFADLIAVEGNPLEDVKVLERVGFVMKGGVVQKGFHSTTR